MSTNPLSELNAFGQSVWYDNIQRSLLTSGQLAAMVAADEVRGITSNPSIFEKALATSDDYDAALQQALQQDATQSERDLFFTLAMQDIRDAATILAPVYTATQGVDGMVSLEVSPHLAHDTEGTVREARQLWASLDLPNVMIKVPGTPAGLPAVEQLISDGININVTLLFSVERYVAVAAAYLRGLERRYAQQLPLQNIASVASFFVSRLDSALDPLLATSRPAWQGKIANANAKHAYQEYTRICNGSQFAHLSAAGARPQRLLWASTSTKNPAYPDLLYVDQLIAPGTVNTMPPATYAAFRDHGTIAPTLEQDLTAARAQLDGLAALGIDLDAITTQLEAEGIHAFVQAFDNLCAAIAAKRQRLAK